MCNLIDCGCACTQVNFSIHLDSVWEILLFHELMMEVPLLSFSFKAFASLEQLSPSSM